MRPGRALLCCLALTSCAHGPTLVEPDVISTRGATEVRLAKSPDGRQLLWGSIGRGGGPGGFDIWEMHEDAHHHWSKPAPASFDSPANDFDPSFAPDGSGVYFFSNRPGGLGGDDLYFAPWNERAQRFGAAVNLGPGVNTDKDEWAPTLSPDGAQLLFASDGRGGRGKHDLFVAVRGADGQWGNARPLAGGVNGPLDDYDATFFGDELTLVFTREVPAANPDDSGSVLMLSHFREATQAWSEPVALGPEVNTPHELNFGPSSFAAEPGVLYFSSRRPTLGRGRVDLYRVQPRVP